MVILLVSLSNIRLEVVRFFFVCMKCIYRAAFTKHGAANLYVKVYVQIIGPQIFCSYSEIFKAPKDPNEKAQLNQVIKSLNLKTNHFKAWKGSLSRFTLSNLENFFGTKHVNFEENSYSTSHLKTAPMNNQILTDPPI